MANMTDMRELERAALWIRDQRLSDEEGIDWLMRVQVPAWLRTVGRMAEADTLAALPPQTDRAACAATYGLRGAILMRLGADEMRHDLTQEQHTAANVAHFALMAVEITLDRSKPIKLSLAQALWIGYRLPHAVGMR